jgi:hypothetical protein
MRITLSPAVDGESRFFNCRIERRLLDKPVDFSLRERSDFADVSPHDGLGFHLWQIAFT